MGRGSVLEGRAGYSEGMSGWEGWRGCCLRRNGGHDLRADETDLAALSGLGPVLSERVERDGLAKRLEEMSLGALLYYVLADEGRGRNEAS